jgi:hypothetical protein
VDAGFDELTARRLAERHPKQVVQNQIEWLPSRTAARNRLGFLRRAIEQDWPKPEGAKGAVPEVQDAKVFAAHYYAAYHDFAGEPATEPFPKDIEMAGKFIERLFPRERDHSQLPEFGRQFGRMMREQHRGDARAKPNLSLAIVLFGDQFLRTQQRRHSTRDRELLGKAREAHQAAFMPDYVAYLRLAEKSLSESNPAAYKAFLASHRRLRDLMTRGPFVTSAERLARFDAEENRLLGFAEFFANDSQHRIAGFWEWDTQLNPRRFGLNSDDAGKSAATGVPA